MHPHHIPIRMIARPKRLPVGEHVGVQLPDGTVVHLTREGASRVSLETFAEGKRCRVVRVAEPARTHHILARVNEALRKPQPYRLMDRNCENFANKLLGDEPESPQVQGVLLFALIVTALKAFA